MLKFRDNNILGHYKILKLINSTSKNHIYKAEDIRTGKTIAIKIPVRFTKKDKENLRDEFRIVSHLFHPNIANILNLYESEDYIFYTMEFIKGELLKNEIKKIILKGHDYNYIRKILLQLALGINFLHNNGIVHMDIKPDNIIVNNTVVLFDFDLSCSIYSTENCKCQGTLAYMAPEILNGSAPGYKSDMYSLGVILYEALTGRLPEEVIIGEKPASPSSLFKDTPTDLDEITLSLLNVDPEKRPSSRKVINIFTNPL